MSETGFKVDFFCVGVAKAGTTTLHDLLNLQSGVSLPARKETNYFSFGLHGKPAFTGPLDDSSVNEPTVTSLDEYLQDFDKKEGSLYGEICPSYVLDGAAANIHEHNPNAKIIILLREPVSRTYSNYQHLVRDGREYASFEDSLAAEADRLAQGWEWFWGLTQNSFYSEAVKEYVETFGEGNVKIILFENFIKDQQHYLKEVMDFIGLDSAAVAHEELDSNKSGVVSGKWKFIHKSLLAQGPLNSLLRVVLPTSLRKKLGALLKRFTTVKGEVTAETRQQLQSTFASDITQLNELTGGQVSSWLEPERVS